MAAEGRPAARKMAANIADKHLVFISCVTRYKKVNRFCEAQRLRKHTLILALVKFFPETTKISIAEISPKVKKKTGLGAMVNCAFGGLGKFYCRLDYVKKGSSIIRPCRKNT